MIGRVVKGGNSVGTWGSDTHNREMAGWLTVRCYFFLLPTSLATSQIGTTTAAPIRK